MLGRLVCILPRRAGCAIGLDTSLQLCQKLCERPRRYRLFRTGMLALACAYELFICIARTAHRGWGSSDMEAMARAGTNGDVPADGLRGGCSRRRSRTRGCQ